MTTIFDDGDFSVAEINGDDRVTYPFFEQGDTATKVIVRPMIVARSDYTPLALNTTHPTVTNAYLTEETNHADAGGGLITFDRIYAQIPAARTVSTGSSAYTFPAYFISGTPNEFSAQKPAVVGTTTDFEYFLPGVTPGITTPLDVSLTALFAPVFTGTGLRATLLTSNTNPTGTDYKASVTAKELLVIESKLTRWKGNILERADVKVRAI